MSLILLFKKIQPYVKPYKWLVILTLLLTLVGSFIAQINAVVLDRTVDAINDLIMTHDLEWKKAAHILTVISIILLGKEILSAVITYAQHYFGEKMRINVSRTFRKPSSTTCSPTAWPSSEDRTTKRANCRHESTKG